MERASIHLELPWRHCQCDEERNRGNQTWRARAPNSDLEDPAPSFMESGPGGSPERRGEGVGVVSGLAMMRPESKQQCLETQHISVPALSVGLWSRLHCFALGELGCGLKLQGGLSSARPVFKATDPTWLVQPQLRHCLQGRLVGCRPSSSTCGPSALPSHRASATSFDLIPTFHPNALTSAPLRLAIQKSNEPYTILD
jgi:hypothetical protein